MNEQDEMKLEEFEKSLNKKHYLVISLLILGLVGVGATCAWSIFYAISSAVSSYLGG